ncbi:MAG: omptin family outer membrane protease [Treponema sp.]|nr:omptin family outer membrane protease [Treponema sp.]
MKNIAVFTVLVIIFISFLADNSAYCLDSNKERKYVFSFGTQFGFVYGQAFELVYPTPGETKGELLSELRWDMKPVFYYGVKLDFNLANIMSRPGFFSSVSYKTGIPADSGVMEDRDWMSVENRELTNFSSHTNKTGDFYWLDAVVGASVPVKNYFYIKPFLSGSWMRFSFTGRDGYLIYAREKTYNPITGNPETFYPINDKPDEGNLSGNVITYKQDWLLVAAGFSIGTKLLSPFSFELSFQISPLTYCATMDEHLLRSITFRDFTYMGLFLEPSGSFSFTLERIEFSLEFAYRHIGRTIGESYKKENDGDYLYSPNEAGAGLSLSDLRFIVKLKF